MRAGLDEEDFNDLEIQELLGVYDEVKCGLYGSEDDSDSLLKDQPDEEPDMELTPIEE